MSRKEKLRKGLVTNIGGRPKKFSKSSIEGMIVMREKGYTYKMVGDYYGTTDTYVAQLIRTYKNKEAKK